MSNITKEFEAMLSWGGSLTGTCVCGRLHFATGTTAPNQEGYYEPGELEVLREKAKHVPNQYIEDAISESVSIGLWHGIPYVYGCPCRRLEILEHLLWDSRDQLVKYFSTRAKREMDALLNTAQAIKEATANE